MAPAIARLHADTPSQAGVAHAVRVSGLVREFDGRRVLDRVELTVAPGEFVALLGRSGSGKSTLLRILSGFDAEVSGDIDVARRRAIVFQEPRLLPWAKVIDNVTLGLTVSDAQARGQAALAEVELAAHHRAWPGTLSGGEAQRVALARALVRDPDLLLLDEPFGALDALTRLRMHALLRKLCEAHQPAVILVTHDVDEAIQLADRVVVLKDGRISLNEVIGFPHPRTRDDPLFARFRTRLLEELGVEAAI